MPITMLHNSWKCNKQCHIISNNPYYNANNSCEIPGPARPVRPGPAGPARSDQLGLGATESNPRGAAGGVGNRDERTPATARSGGGGGGDDDPSSSCISNLDICSRQ